MSSTGVVSSEKLSSSGAPEENQGLTAEPELKVCEDCGKGYLWSGEPCGTETKLGELSVYHSAPPGDTAAQGSAILYVHDGFGWRFVNNRLMCDRLAAATGVHVYMPDFYDDQPIVTEEQAQKMIDPQPTVLGKVAQGFRIAVSIPSMIMSMQKFGVKRTQPLVDDAIESIKKLHAGEGTKVGAVGYCWGGKYCLRLGAQKKVVACVVCHPSMVDPKEDDLKAMGAACFFNLAGSDFVFNEKLWKKTQECIQEAGVPLEYAVYPGTTHGFAVRCSESDEVAIKASNEAFKATAEWFRQYLL